MSRKAIEREIRKKFILEAARQLFDEKGIENTSMDDIASAAEYTRRTLYAYFKSRDEISLSILIEDLSARWTEQKRELATADTGLQKIIKWGESLYSFTCRHRSSIRLQLYWDFKGIDRKLITDDIFASFQTINNELAEGLRRIFHLGLSDGSLRPDLNVDLAISHFLYSFRSIVNRAHSSTYSFAYFEPEEYVRTYLDIFARGIKNEGVGHSEIK
ncbi:MAG TPA: TetR/AcrR family transcriptional regulator [Acidobacteriota bacterium]|nr:TetR/AcrR family transcriptional regulator [Acidobacteriota bacterium]